MIENPSLSAAREANRLSDEQPNDATSRHPSDAVTAGSLLREARQASGLHIAALAVALKVPVKKLEALEMDRHDLLPDMVFVRALAFSVCRSLKIDSAPIVALLPESGRSVSSAAPVAVNASFSAYRPPTKPAGRSAISTPAAVAGLLLVIGALVLVLLPSIRVTLMSSGLVGQTKDAIVQAVGRLGMATPGGDTAVDADSEPPVLGINEVAGPKDAASSAGGHALVSPTSVPAEPAAGIAAVADSNTTASVPASAAPALLKNAADVALDGALVSFSATTQPSWVKVTDAKGVVVLSRTISPGEQVAARGALPLVVVVGRADVTRVMVRGAAFDLGAYSKENIARFEVK